MNTIKCPSCRFENTFGLVFCTNCGASLYGSEQGRPSDPTVRRAGGQGPPETLAYPESSPVTVKSSAAKYLIVAVAGVLLISGALVLSALFYYLGSRNNMAAVNTANYNANKTIALSPNRNANAANTANTNKNQPVQNTNTAAIKPPEIDDTDFKENPFTLPPSVGPFEQQGVMTGNAADDFLGADEITKTTYSKKGKEVEFVLAKFSTRDAAKTGYEDFLKGFKDSGAKVLGKKKVQNKSGVNNGEVSIFTFSKRWNAIVYSERYGVRFIAPDRYTLIEFAKEFDKIFNTN